MNVTMIVSIVSAFLALSSVLIIGIRIGKFQHSHVSNDICDRRYKTISDKLTYMQLLLMELTSEEQRNRAREKMHAFGMERAVCETN